MKYIAAYGSLRENGEWYKTLRQLYKHIRKTASAEIQGFEMFQVEDPEDGSMQDWTAAKFSGGDRTIKVDIMLTTSKVFDYISKVIECSEFIPYTMNINGYPCIIYLYKGKVKRKNLIKDGNSYSVSKEENSRN